MKRTFALILALILMTSFTAYAGEIRFTAESGSWSAPEASYILGDVDGDGEMSVTDALYLQYYLSRFLPLGERGQLRADVDRNNTVESADVTCIQRWLVGIDTVDYISMDIDKVNAMEQERQRRRQILDEIESFTRSKGVDISEHNGSVDMNKLKAAGYRFVIIRLGYGDDETDQDDSRFEENVRKAEAAGLDWGAYIYSYALSVGAAKSELNHTLRLLRGKHPTMPIAFDWEDDDYKERNGMPSNAEVLRIARTYLSGIKAAGYYPMIYTGYSWLKGAFSDSSMDAYDVWYAQWSTSYDYHDRPIGIWQYGGETNFIESPYISGLSGTFDKNYSYKNYPMIIKAYGYNNHTPLLESYASTGDMDDVTDDIPAESENLPPECNGVMGDSLRKNQ